MGVVPQFDHGESVEAVRAYFDTLGAQEWDRLTSDPAGLVSLEVHRRFLARFVTPGMRVLEIGAGPGWTERPTSCSRHRVHSEDPAVSRAPDHRRVASSGRFRRPGGGQNSPVVTLSRPRRSR
ncbi:MAG: hypothetical protein QOJ60_545 [Actinomycetota bacterium]|nr:hypothetical protein [Actinomycetota bacterium]MDQ1662831.1 hypothetical protein [Blastococcus sp.]